MGVGLRLETIVTPTFDYIIQLHIRFFQELAQLDYFE